MKAVLHSYRYQNLCNVYQVRHLNMLNIYMYIYYQTFYFSDIWHENNDRHWFSEGISNGQFAKYLGSHFRSYLTSWSSQIYQTDCVEMVSFRQIGSSQHIFYEQIAILYTQCKTFVLAKSIGTQVTLHRIWHSVKQLTVVVDIVNILWKNEILSELC